MGHIHEKIDFVVNAWIINDNKLLFIYHKKLDTWLPVGGHIELDEDPDIALYREIWEESGLTKENLLRKGHFINVDDPGCKSLNKPDFVDIHPISDTHQHVSLNYIFKSNTDQVKLQEYEHTEIKWFSLEELNSLTLKPAIKQYANQVLQGIDSLATFAGGCFWCIESAFAHLPGVIKVESGFTGGSFENPSYEQIHDQDTGHKEAVKIYYNSQIISYSRLLEIFWMQIDPTDAGGQFVDRGDVYKTAIFYHDAFQQQLALNSKKLLENKQIYSSPIVTEILPATDFYLAEDYHQEYYKKNPERYQLYRQNSGRDNYIDSNWKANPLNLNNL